MLTRGNVGVAKSDVTEATGEEGSQSLSEHQAQSQSQNLQPKQF